MTVQVGSPRSARRQKYQQFLTFVNAMESRATAVESGAAELKARTISSQADAVQAIRDLASGLEVVAKDSKLFARGQSRLLRVIRALAEELEES